MNPSGLQHYRWYHGRVTRSETDQLLHGKQPGIYLVRDSSTISGDYVLSVSENNRVSHYIINNKVNHYKIGEQTFADIPSIINFYKDHFLDTTILTGAIEREMKVQALYNFDGNDAEDLPFQKGDILTVINQDEEAWWTAENRSGQRGSIPVPYVQILSDSQTGRVRPTSTPVNVPNTPSSYVTDPYHNRNSHPVTSTTPQPPFTPSRPAQQPPRPSPTGRVLARALIDRACSPYDNGQLSFKKGDLLTVSRQNDNGIWEGELHGKTGEFPMSHVGLIDPNTMEPYSNGV